MEKLNRASRLLLGALVEAYDVLQQLQAECGDTVQDQASQASLARVRQFVNTTQPPVTPQPQQQSLHQQQQQSQQQQSEQEHNELSAVATAATSNNIIATTDSNTDTTEDTTMDSTMDDTKDDTKEITKDTTEEDTKNATPAMDTPDHRSCVAPAKPHAKVQGLPDIVTSHALLSPPRAKAPPPPSLPDVVADSLHGLGRRMSPRKVARRRVFRLSTLRELHQQRQPAPSSTPPSPDTPPTPPPLSWAEAGQKLASIATTLDTPPPRRRSLPALGRDDQDGEERRRGRRMSQVVAWHADTGPKMETDKIINNVLKAVQVFGLFLIIRKFENMLK